MIKQTFIAATAIFTFALASTPALAEEIDCTVTPDIEACQYGIMPINETNETMPINDANETTPVVDADGQPIRDHDYPETNDPDDDQVEVIEDTEIIEETEPALWPMYLSLGALTLAVIVFIVLNLFGGKKRK